MNLNKLLEIRLKLKMMRILKPKLRENQVVLDLVSINESFIKSYKPDMVFDLERDLISNLNRKSITQTRRMKNE